MKRKAFFHQFIEQLLPIYTNSEAQIIAEQVFERIAGIKKSNVIIEGDVLIPEEIESKIILALKELLSHKPLQQVIGEAWFYKLRFSINEDVLIPRPETEELVELVIQAFSNQRDISILEIGTGSGCIPIAIKKNLPDTTVFSIDVSEQAIELARRNGIENNVDVSFLLIDFLDETTWNQLPKFDVIVSNPPYIPTKEKEKMDKNVVDHEPHLALFVPDENPLLFYKKIADFGKEHLNKNGKIFVEIYEEEGQNTFDTFQTTYSHVELKKDLFGKDRFIIATNN